jgi:hypothetical protein
MEPKTYQVIDQNFIQELPDKRKKPFFLYGNDWKRHCASLPVIKRGDNGAWTVGQHLVEGRDFTVNRMSDKAYYKLAFAGIAPKHSEVAVPVGTIKQPSLKEDGRGVSEKMLAAEKYVDRYIERFHEPPTYREVAMDLGISRTAAYERLRRYRGKMVRQCAVAKEKEINQLRAENTRLREALQFIAKDDDWQIYDAVDEDFKLMRQMVKATLKSNL